MWHTNPAISGTVQLVSHNDCSSQAETTIIADTPAKTTDRHGELYLCIYELSDSSDIIS